MLVTTGRKETLSISKGSEIEVSSNDDSNVTTNVWYCASLEENLAKSKRKKLSVCHLNPLNKLLHYSPPSIKTAFHRQFRPIPPPDPFPEVDFEEGDVVDAAHRGGWCYGWVVKVLGNRRFLVYLRFEPDVIEVDRKHLRPHLVWENEEWFGCEKRHLIESEFSAGKNVEVRMEVEQLGEVWVPAIAIMDDEDENLVVKYKSLRGEEDEWRKISVPYSKIRPSPSPVGLRSYKLMEKVEALNESGWCRGVVSKTLSGNRYTVLLGENKQSSDFNYSKLRPLVEWKDGAWQTEEKVVDDTDEETPLAAEEPTASTRIRVTVRPALRGIKVSGAGQNLRATRSSSVAMDNPPPASSNGGNVAAAGKNSVIKTETPLSETAALPEELGTKMADVVMNENTPVTSQPEIAATKVFHSSVVLGIAAASVTKPAGKTQGKTSPRKKLQAMRNQKGTANDSVGEKAPEETRNRESVNKRKRGQPRKFVSTEPKQKIGVAGNGSKAATIDLADMADDDTPLAAWINGKSASQTPDPMLNSVVEKHVVETPPVKDTTMVLPFAKKSPLWKVLESMEAFKAVPQRPHFSPLVECEEESREGDAIGAMVTFTGLIEKVNKIQVDDPVSMINRINECFLKLDKHGFNVAAPRSRIGKLLSIKESQTWALEELKVAERDISEKDNKRRKCEEDIEDVSKKIAELQRQQVLLKEQKVTMDKEIARMHSNAAVLDQKVQNVEQEFRAIVAAPWN